jgi:hypothetical protein
LRLRHREQFGVPGNVAIPPDAVRGLDHHLAILNDDAGERILAVAHGLSRQRDTARHHHPINGVQSRRIHSGFLVPAPRVKKVGDASASA